MSGTHRGDEAPTGRARQVSTAILGFLTVIVGLSEAGTALKYPAGSLAKGIGNLPPWVLIVILTLATLAAFLTGTAIAVLASRRGRKAMISLDLYEDRLINARTDLVELDRSVVERATEYAELGRRLRSAQQLLQITEEQVGALRETIEQSVRSSKSAWWVLVIMYLLGIATGLVENWVAGDISAPWHWTIW